MGMRPPIVQATLLLAGLLSACPDFSARGQSLVADLSSHLISVTAGFAGTDLLLFGSVADEGDVIVVLRGPDSRVAVRKKERSVVGIWVNKSEIVFTGVPSFYRVASSRPLDQFKRGRVLEVHEIGLENLRFTAATPVSEELENQFHSALIRNKQRQALYSGEGLPISFLGERLFRTRISVPSNVPTGTYTVTVYLVRAGNVISAQSIPLVVSKIGVGARVYDFAHQHAAGYGLLAVAMALFAGWLGSALFRKV